MALNSTEIYHKCELSRGGFPDEVVFRLKTLGGDTLVGTANVQYCRKLDGPLAGDEPKQRTPGLVAARIVGHTKDGNLLVSVPSGDVVRVASETVAEEQLTG